MTSKLSTLASIYSKLKSLRVKRPSSPPPLNKSFQEQLVDAVDVLHPETQNWAKMLEDGTIIEYDDYASAVCGGNGSSTVQKTMLEHRKYLMKKDGLSNTIPFEQFNPNVGIVTTVDSQNQSLSAMMNVHARYARSTDRKEPTSAAGGGQVPNPFAN